MTRFLFVFALQCALAVTAISQTAQERAETKDLPTQTMLWSAPHNALAGQPVALYAEVIGNGRLAPVGNVTFIRDGKPMGRAPVLATANTNFLRYSSQFNNPAWVPLDESSVLTPDYAMSPLGDKTAFRIPEHRAQGGNLHQSGCRRSARHAAGDVQRVDQSEYAVHGHGDWHL
jgi:hypothetical protein